MTTTENPVYYRHEFKITNTEDGTHDICALSQKERMTEEEINERLLELIQEYPDPCKAQLVRVIPFSNPEDLMKQLYEEKSKDIGRPALKAGQPALKAGQPVMAFNPPKGFKRDHVYYTRSDQFSDAAGVQMVEIDGFAQVFKAVDFYAIDLQSKVRELYDTEAQLTKTHNDIVDIGNIMDADLDDKEKLVRIKAITDKVEYS